MEFHPKLSDAEMTRLGEYGVKFEGDVRKILSVGLLPSDYPNPGKVPVLSVNPGHLTELNEICGIYCGARGQVKIWSTNGELTPDMPEYIFHGNNPVYDQYDCILDPNLIVQPDKVNDAKNILLNGDYFAQLLNALHASQAKHMLTIVSTASEFTSMQYRALPRTTVEVEAHNCSALGSNVTQVPLCKKDSVNNVSDRTTLCYYVPMMPPNPANMATSKNCTVVMKGLEWVSIEQTPDYGENLKKAKFLVCPPLCGLDNPLVWDAIACGVVPIVLNTPIAPLHRSHGCMVVDNWEDVTEELLKSNEHLVPSA